MKKKVVLLTMLISLMLTLTSYAAIPKVINFQGRAIDKTTSLPLQGSFNITFSIYDMQSGGTPLWIETWGQATAQVQITNGIFSVALGSHVSINLPFDKQYYLGVKIGDDPEMAPRTRLASVGYAYRAEKAEHSPFLYSGARDIDINVTEQVYIHIEEKPTSVTMYLYGEKFSPQFYTELAEHNHPGGPHTHSGDNLLLATGQPNSNDKRFYLLGGFQGWGSGWVSGNTGSATGDTGLAGVNGGTRSTVVKTYLNDMHIFLDGTDITNQLLTQTDFSEFGNGTSSHSLNTYGSGELDITNLSNWSPGVHKIEFVQLGSSGGRIKYYIYVK